MKIIQAVVISFSFLLSLASAQGNPLEMGWIGPLTGNSAVLGIDSADVATMVFEKSDPRIKLHIEDDSYQTAKTVAAYKKLVHSNGVKVLFVLTYGGLFAVSPLAEKDGVLVIDPLDCNAAVARLPGNTICFAAMTEEIGRMNAQHALAKKLRSGAILYFANDPFMGTVAATTAEEIKTHGGEVMFSEGYEAGTADFRALFLKAREKKADAIYFYGYDEMGAGFRQLRTLGMTTPLYSVATLLSPGVSEAAGDAARGTVYSVFTPSGGRRYEEFLQEFEARFHRKPALDIATVPTFDVANVIAEFARTRLRVDPMALKDYLYKLKDYQGASGLITLDTDGATRSLEIKTHVVQ